MCHIDFLIYSDCLVCAILTFLYILTVLYEQVVGEYCAKRDPHLAFVVYSSALGGSSPKTLSDM